MIQNIDRTEIILFVSDQQKSADFYQKLLGINPSLHVPGMTEFNLTSGCTLGLMPKTGISRLLHLENPPEDALTPFPKCELYLLVKDVEAAVEHALSCGAELVSPVRDRDWGDAVGYLRDLDGHLIAFATKIIVKNE